MDRVVLLQRGVEEGLLVNIRASTSAERLRRTQVTNGQICSLDLRSKVRRELDGRNEVAKLMMQSGAINNESNE